MRSARRGGEAYLRGAAGARRAQADRRRGSRVPAAWCAPLGGGARRGRSGAEARDRSRMPGAALRLTAPTVGLARAPPPPSSSLPRLGLPELSLLRTHPLRVPARLLPALLPFSLGRRPPLFSAFSSPLSRGPPLGQFTARRDGAGRAPGRTSSALRWDPPARLGPGLPRWLSLLTHLWGSRVRNFQLRSPSLVLASTGGGGASSIRPAEITWAKAISIMTSGSRAGTAWICHFVMPQAHGSPGLARDRTEAPAYSIKTPGLGWAREDTWNVEAQVTLSRHRAKCCMYR